MIWYTSDNHFYHEPLIKWLNRPFADVQDMNEQMIERWNSRVAPSDTVIHLGDFALGDPELIPGLVERLNGHKHIVYGNHDLQKKKFHEQANWSSRQEELYILDSGHNVWLHHLPYGVTWDKRGYIRPKAVQKFDIALCGHVHDKWVINDHECINVGVDVQDFYPRTLEELLERTKDQPRFDSNIQLPV